MVCKERVEALVKTHPLSVLTIVYNSPLIYFHYSRLRLASVLFFVTITVLDEVVR